MSDLMPELCRCAMYKHMSLCDAPYMSFSTVCDMNDLKLVHCLLYTVLEDFSRESQMSRFT